MWELSGLQVADSFRCSRSTITESISLVYLKYAYPTPTADNIEVAVAGASHSVDHNDPDDKSKLHFVAGDFGKLFWFARFSSEKAQSPPPRIRDGGGHLTPGCQ